MSCFLPPPPHIPALVTHLLKYISQASQGKSKSLSHGGLWLNIPFFLIFETLEVKFYEKYALCSMRAEMVLIK